jgi:hypothetical protein
LLSVGIGIVESLRPQLESSKVVTSSRIGERGWQECKNARKLKRMMFGT